jgi:hypothetical protein
MTWETAGYGLENASAGLSWCPNRGKSCPLFLRRAFGLLNLVVNAAHADSGRLRQGMFAEVGIVGFPENIVVPNAAHQDDAHVVAVDENAVIFGDWPFGLGCDETKAAQFARRIGWRDISDYKTPGQPTPEKYFVIMLCAIGLGGFITSVKGLYRESYIMVSGGWLIAAVTVTIGTTWIIIGHLPFFSERVSTGARVDPGLG